MNLKTYYQRLREVEQSIVEPFVVLISHETADGGKEGVFTEVPRQVAAKMIADGSAHAAGEEAAREFHDKRAEAKRLADQEAAATKMQVTLVPADFRRMSRGGKE